MNPLEIAHPEKQTKKKPNNSECGISQDNRNYGHPTRKFNLKSKITG